MDIKIANEQIIISASVLEGMTGKSYNVKFSYAVAKNHAILKTEAEALLKAQEPPEEYQEYDRKRLELAQEWAEKDENGRPKLIEGLPPQVQLYDIPDMDGFNKEWEKLKKKYKKQIDAREKQRKEFEEMKQEVRTIKSIEQIDAEDLPEEITPQQITALLPFLKGKPGEKKKKKR